MSVSFSLPQLHFYNLLLGLTFWGSLLPKNSSLTPLPKQNRPKVILELLCLCLQSCSSGWHSSQNGKHVKKLKIKTTTKPQQNQTKNQTKPTEKALPDISIWGNKVLQINNICISQKIISKEKSFKRRSPSSWDGFCPLLIPTFYYTVSILNCNMLTAETYCLNSPTATMMSIKI